MDRLEVLQNLITADNAVLNYFDFQSPRNTVIKPLGGLFLYSGLADKNQSGIIKLDMQQLTVTTRWIVTQSHSCNMLVNLKISDFVDCLDQRNTTVKLAEILSKNFARYNAKQRYHDDTENLSIDELLDNPRSRLDYEHAAGYFKKTSQIIKKKFLIDQGCRQEKDFLF